MEEIKRV